ncbi:MAG: hypothetical protein ABSH51_01125 [Solirubrobacteraceae bacterium]
MTRSPARSSGRISRRMAAGLVALALAAAAPAALAASGSSSQPAVVHEAIEHSGLIVVSGYDGGAPLAPGR